MLKKFEISSLPTGSDYTHEYSRILSAAVINARFRSMLLNNPAQAIARGYSGEHFMLGKNEKQHLSSIQVNSLADFAKRLANI
jgi:hypothetical protein